jgi:Putative MetA-pathway of phenol degradation
VRRFIPVTLWTASCALLAGSLHAQDLAPRAYTITPQGTNAFTLSNVFNDGDLLFDGTVPITDASARLNAPSISYYRALSVFGRSANATAGVAYGVGTFEGTVLGESRSIYRSGLFDSVFRLSVNLAGGPAMSLGQMRQWRQKTLLGASVKIVVPTGQYDPTKLINLGSNRWSFKPELGLSRRWGHWLVDGYAGVWLFTKNPEFFSHNEFVPGTQSQTQKPIVAIEAHLSYDFRPRLWMSLDGNFWRGGQTSLNGVENAATLQENSRIGVTASFPLTRHQTLKVGYAQGAYIRFGGNYRIVSAAWQYSWVTGAPAPPKP